MTLHALRHPVTLLSILLLPLSACNKADPVQQAIRAADAGRHSIDAMSNALAALPPECTLGAPGVGPAGVWITAPTVEAAAGNPIVHVFTLDKTARTRALHVALNRQALRELEKVETRDSQGNWSDGGSVIRREAPAACDYVWLEQALPAARQVEALRFSFRSGSSSITTAAAGVLQDVTG